MKRTNQNKFNKLRREFLPETLEIVERPTAPLGNIIIWLVFVLLLAFILWACIGKMDEVATARGQITVEEGAQEIRAAGTGIVTAVKVKEGDIVQCGDVLYCMEKEIEQKNIDYSKGEIGLLELRIDLLSDLLAGEDITVYRKDYYNTEQMEVIESIISMDESARLSIEECELAVQTAKKQYDLAGKNLNNGEQKTDYLKEQGKLQKAVNDLKSTSQIELEMLQDNYQYAVSEAEKYKNCYIKINREDAVELEEDSYFIVDIIGSEVFTEEGEDLGKVVDVLQTGSNDVYTVKTLDGKEILLPAIEDVIKNVDIENKKIVIHLMEGLI